MTVETYTKNDTKEDFCGACAAVPLALVGAGTAGLGTKKHGTTKKIMLWTGVGITVLSIIIVIIYLAKCKDCR
jgi:hypothetical protein|tara:strand:+ start:66 stop:284 length:219 start_codon:yes stop_codon:yes gene_type:complete